MRGPVSFSAARVQVRDAAPVPTAPTSRSAGLGTSVLQPHTHICTPGPEATLTPRFPAKRLISNRRHVEVSILPHYFFFSAPLLFGLFLWHIFCFSPKRGTHRAQSVRSWVPRPGWAGEERSRHLVAVERRSGARGAANPAEGRRGGLRCRGCR